jgi:ribose transport system permease protein
VTPGTPKAQSDHQAVPNVIVRLHLERYAIIIILIIAFGAFSLLLPSTFPTVSNIRVMAQTESVFMILAIGLLFPLRSGDFDLSIGATMNLSAMSIAALTVQHGFPWVLAVFIGLGLGLLVGAVNGFLVVVVGLDGFIATLATMTAVDGLAYGVSGGTVLSGFPQGLLNFASTSVGGVPLSVIYGLAIAVVAWYVFQWTPWGRYLLFVGGNRDAARLAGINTGRIRFMAFVICGIIAAFGGVVLASTVGSADPSIGAQYLLPPFAAAFLGTTVINIGRFNAPGTVIGLYLLVIVVTGLELLGAPSWIGDVFDGVALVVAISFARFVTVYREKRA